MASQKIVRLKVSRHRYWLGDSKSSMYRLMGMVMASRLVAKLLLNLSGQDFSVHVQQNPVGDHHQVARQRGPLCVVPSETLDICDGSIRVGQSSRPRVPGAFVCFRDVEQPTLTRWFCLKYSTLIYFRLRSCWKFSRASIRPILHGFASTGIRPRFQGSKDPRISVTSTATPNRKRC